MPEVSQIFEALKQEKLPPLQDSSPGDTGVRQAVKAIAERKPDSEIDRDVAALDAKKVQEALEIAQKNAQLADKAMEPLTNALGNVESQIKRHVDLAVPVLSALAKARDTTSAELAGASMADLENALSPGKLQDSVERLQRGFRAVQHQYNALRNR